MQQAMKIILLHYRYLPSLAGVELIMGAHARLLVAAGHEVTILAAAGAPQGFGEQVVILPGLAAASPGFGVKEFPQAVARLERELLPWCEGADRVVVHNCFTMPFHLAATEALRNLADHLPPGRFLHWLHDFSDDLPPALRVPHPRVLTVAVSESRAEEFAQRTGGSVAAVVPNGVDPLDLLPLTPSVRRFAEEHRLLSPESGWLLFHPTRLVPRKRVELGLELIAVLREHGFRSRLLVTAAPDEHRPDAGRYHRELLDLRRSLGLGREVLFLHEHFPVASADLAALYSLADVLWFPSQQEGFGLPIVEGALHRLPIFCADHPPMNRFGLPMGGFFDPTGDIDAVATQFVAFMEEYRAFWETRKTAIERFSWDTLGARLCAVIADPDFSPSSTPHSPNALSP